MLFGPKEHASFVPTADRLPIRARLKMEIDSAGFVPWLQNIFSQADQIANLTNSADWRGSEVVELPNRDAGDQTLTFQAWQIDLADIANQENAGLAVNISFEYDLGGHQMQIRGHEITFTGKVPKTFNQDSPEINTVKAAIIQAMMVPQELG